MNAVRISCNKNDNIIELLCLFFSAGVGRTGAFIAIYVQLARAERERTIDVYNYVQYMRKQRPSMVLNEVRVLLLVAIMEIFKQPMIMFNRRSTYSSTMLLLML